MEAYINSAVCISHHPTFSDDFFFETTDPLPASSFLFATHPVYKELIPSATLRRASHILKMGIGAGLMCLKNAGLEMPDAIITGTAMGCFEDTDKFLLNLINNDERMLAPTPFIQSTHNTVSGQLALLLKCHGYNFTYTHQNFSFEYALMDALMLLEEGNAENVLIGGMDELNPALCELFERAGHIKKKEDSLQLIWNSTSKGFVAGEGAAFFSVSKYCTDKSLAKINGIKTIQEIKNIQDLTDQIHLFLNEITLNPEDISLVLSGINGDAEQDTLLNIFTFRFKKPTAYFKQLCGEYFTASGFALWFAANVLKRQTIPSCATANETSFGKLQHILIVNHCEGKQYSLMCVSAC